MVIFMLVGVERLSIEWHENLGNLVFLLQNTYFISIYDIGCENLVFKGWGDASVGKSTRSVSVEPSV